ncbi:MAG: hypothetical protein R2750_03465 [Bacteroidales bacterium]
MQTLLIGIGAVVGSGHICWATGLGISKEAPEGAVPQNVIYSFYFGAAVLLSAIIWTRFVSTKEYPPDFYEEEHKEEKTTKFKIPKTMWQLLLVQFFSWFALFSMWVFTTAPAVALHFYNSPDPNSAGYQEARNWVSLVWHL